jgi:regulator of replication initiation timing
MTFEMLRDTVDRQDAEIKRLRRENEALEVMRSVLVTENAELRVENALLREQRKELPPPTAEIVWR